MGTSHSPLPRSSVQSWGVARLCLSWDTCPSESQMARFGLKSSGVRGRTLNSGSAPEYPVQGAGVTTVELLRLSVQLRCMAGLNLHVQSVQLKKKKKSFAEILSFSISVHRCPAYEKRHLSVWGAGGDEYFWTMESSLCLPLESGQCQCCLLSAWLWSRHLYPKWSRRKWSALESPIPLLRGWALPVAMPCDCPGCSCLFPWQHGLCDLLR